MQITIQYSNIPYFVMHRIAVWVNFIDILLQQAYTPTLNYFCKLSHYCESSSEASPKVSQQCESYSEASPKVSQGCESHSEASPKVSQQCESPSEMSRTLSQHGETIIDTQLAFHNIVKAYRKNRIHRKSHFKLNPSASHHHIIVHHY